MIQGLLFDLDGTLVDSNWVWQDVGQAFLLSHGCTPQEGLPQKLEELSFDQSAEYLVRRYGLPMEPPQVVAALTALARETYLTRVALKPGAAELLRWSKAAGYPMAIATALDAALARELVGKLGIGGYFQGIYTCGTLGLPKTDPAFYHKAAQQLGLSTAQVAVFDDAPHALRTARAAGCCTVGVADPSWTGSRQQEARETSHRFLQSLEEMLGS